MSAAKNTISEDVTSNGSDHPKPKLLYVDITSMSRKNYMAGAWNRHRKTPVNLLFVRPFHGIMKQSPYFIGADHYIVWDEKIEKKDPRFNETKYYAIKVTKEDFETASNSDLRSILPVLFVDRPSMHLANTQKEIFQMYISQTIPCALSEGTAYITK